MTHGRAETSSTILPDSMGLLKFFARFGAVGGTARWAARWYKMLRAQEPDTKKATDADLFRIMLRERFRLFRDDRKQTYLLVQCDNVQGLIGFVIEILKVEANLHRNDGDSLHDFVKVIDEELQRLGIEIAARYGQFQRIGDYAKQITTPPNP